MNIDVILIRTLGDTERRNLLSTDETVNGQPKQIERGKSLGTDVAGNGFVCLQSKFTKGENIALIQMKNDANKTILIV